MQAESKNKQTSELSKKIEALEQARLDDERRFNNEATTAQMEYGQLQSQFSELKLTSEVCFPLCDE